MDSSYCNASVIQAIAMLVWIQVIAMLVRIQAIAMLGEQAV